MLVERGLKLTSPWALKDITSKHSSSWMEHIYTPKSWDTSVWALPPSTSSALPSR